MQIIITVPDEESADVKSWLFHAIKCKGRNTIQLTVSADGDWRNGHSQAEFTLQGLRLANDDGSVSEPPTIQE